MSKFILSNSVNLLSAKVRNERYGYETSGSVAEKSIEFVSFYKLNVKDTNFLRIGNDFISITGTLLFQGLKGENLLKKVYEEFLEKGDAIRSLLLGNYAVIVKHNEQLTVFGEESYFYDIFYYKRDGYYIVSNDLYEIYQLVDGLEVDKHNILEQAYLNGVIGNETVLKEVCRLSGDQKIIVNTKTSSLEVLPFPVDWSRLDVNEQEAVESLTNNLKAVASEIMSTYPTTAICMTGGLDSRISLAALLSAGAKPALYYGKGNSSITNTHFQDYNICEVFSHKYGLQLTQMDWGNPSPIDKDWPYCLEKFGILYHAYAGSNSIMSSLIDIKEEFITFGLVGEMFRTLTFTENRYSFTIEDFVDEYYFPKNNAGEHISHHCDDFGAFRSRLVNKFVGVCKRYNLDPNNMKVEDFFYLNLEYRANADNIMLNLSNRMRYCTWLLVAPSVIKLANISVEHLKNSHYMLCTLESLYPSCLEIPVFSHEHEMVYDKRRAKLTKPARVRIRQTLTSVIPTDVKERIVRTFMKKNKENKAKALNVSENLIDSFRRSDFCRHKEEKLDRLDIALLQYYNAFQSSIS